MPHFLDLLSSRQIQGKGHEALVASRFDGKKFYHKELKAHYGCVNALAFSRQQCQYLASAGDDRRVLIWDVHSTILEEHPGNAKIMKGSHESNVFSVDFDCVTKNVFSGGNDMKVLVHDLKTAEILDVFPHDEEVHCVACHPDLPNLFATACSDGRILMYDLRTSNEDPVLLQGSDSPYYCVHFNPLDSRLLVTANQVEGVSLLDHRKPKVAIMKYGSRNRRKSAMCALFNAQGSKIFALGKKLNPVIYEVSHPRAVAEFDHPGYYNSCTMKSGSFGGDQDNYVFSGSDDFNIYGWKIPELNENDKTLLVKRADFVWKGHESIVNQVRFNPVYNLAATSGVEKKVILWSPFNITNRTCDSKKSAHQYRKIRRRRSREWLIQNSLDFFDLEHQSVEENPRMLAYFDRLVQIDLSSEDESETETDDHNSTDAETLSVDANIESDVDIDAVIAKKRKRQSRTEKRTTSQDSSDYVKQTIQSAREALIESDFAPPQPQLDQDIHNEILESLNNESSDDEDDENSENNNLGMFKKRTQRGKCYRRQS